MMQLFTLVGMLSTLITFSTYTKIEKRTVRIIFLNRGAGKRHKIYIYGPLWEVLFFGGALPLLRVLPRLMIAGFIFVTENTRI